MKFLAIAAIAATLISEVSAHSRVWSVWVDGSDQGKGEGRYIRQPPNNDPVKDLTSPNLACNVNGKNSVPEYVTVPAGHTLTSEWCTYELLPAAQSVLSAPRSRQPWRRHYS